jgi:hypothetical protein
MDDIAEILYEAGLSQCHMEAALELSRLISEETGLCCNDLGRLTWSSYKKMEGES